MSTNNIAGIYQTLSTETKGVNSVILEQQTSVGFASISTKSNHPSLTNLNLFLDPDRITRSWNFNLFQFSEQSESIF
ncbi:hypothetical protein L1987_84284 [Smallanthus sonchifolius]|uniref:Uncharacterized protein n=1 Tax=Smallanthus sonchifolius TaxID=185202 RepID=A0ACB8YDH0_9ASTR|nr:hypothetical protein L1987_84284 [Smallanthus sonchifolius]